MEYQALYRQFRPETFDDVVGQEHIVTALSNQVESGKVSHAYLFCGTRGTGKTTTARILSRAVNCTDRNGANPCNKCEACRSILDGSAIDVVEIDAASNTSVDNIREIRDEIAYPPVTLNYKVYIIDEVHMLSAGAFNALLKTLEEPPEHVIFILATTEYHKVPATILSRCQRYDFKRIESQKISDRIRYVCEKSGHTIEDEAVSTITYAADGSMRDALAILDKCTSLDSNNITSEFVTKLLGIVDDNTIFDLFNAIANFDIAEVIEKTENAIRDGRDPILFTSYLIEHVRCLLVASLTVDLSETLQMSSERAKLFKEQSYLFTTDSLMRLANLLNNTYKLQKESPNPKVVLEIGLISLCTKNNSYFSTIPVSKTFTQNNQMPNKQQPVKPVQKEFVKNSVAAVKSVASSVNSDVVSNWSDVIKEVAAQHKMRLFAELMQSNVSVNGDNLTVFLPKNHLSNKESIDNSENLGIIVSAVEKICGKRYNVSMDFGDVSVSRDNIQSVDSLQGMSNVDADFDAPPPSDKERLFSDAANILNLADKFPGIVSIDDESED